MSLNIVKHFATCGSVNKQIKQEALSDVSSSQITGKSLLIKITKQKAF